MTVATAPSPTKPKAPARRPTIPHIGALDGLRGVAVIAVLAFHGGYLDGGYLGVDLFFVLSGFLITSLLLAETGSTGKVGLAEFWARRCRRLLPAMCAVAIAVALGSRWLADPLQWRAIRDDGLATLAYVANWHAILSGGGYAEGTGGRSPFQHTWSLAIEEQFYLVWPLVVAFVARRRPGASTARTVLHVAVGVAGLSALSGLVLSRTGVSVSALYLGTHVRIAAVAVGAAVAARQVDRRNRGLGAGDRTVAETAGFVGMAVLIVAYALMGLDSSILFRGGLFACSVAGGAVVWSIAVSPKAGLGRLFEARALREVGLRSYGLYLWHWPIFVWLDPVRTGLDGLALFALRLVVSAIVAMVSYVVIEQPIRHLRISAADTFVASLIGLLVTAVVVAACAVGAPPPLATERGSGPALSLSDASGKGIQLGLFGDSVAENLASQGVRPVQGDLGVVVRDGGVWGCLLMASAGPARDGYGKVVPPRRSEPCAKQLQARIRAMEPPADVVVALFGGIPFDAKVDGAWRTPCSDAYRSRYRELAADAVQQLGASGAPVTVVIPEDAGTDLVARTYGFDDVGERRACLAEELTKVATDAGVGVLDLNVECRPNGCAGQGRDLRRDGVHYQGKDAQVVARWLVPLLLDRARPARE
ncbi:MAG: acyltransferase [Acidimicrobiales bacterium]